MRSVSERDAIASIGSANPLLHSANVVEGLEHEVFASRSLGRQVLRDHPPIGLHSPTEFHWARLRGHDNHGILSWGLVPYGVYGHPEPTDPELATLGTLRFQVFSTS